MPVGDFPTVFPTIMTCRLNRMVTSKKTAIYTDDIAFFYILSFFFDHGFSFADHEDVFFANTCIFCIFKLTMRCCIFLHIMDIVYCSWKDLFAIYIRILHVCSTWKTRDGRKCVKNFGVLGVSGLNK